MRLARMGSLVEKANIRQDQDYTEFFHERMARYTEARAHGTGRLSQPDSAPSNDRNSEHDMMNQDEFFLFFVIVAVVCFFSLWRYQSVHSFPLNDIARTRRITMRELRLFNEKPEHNARTIQQTQQLAPGNVSIFRLTTSSEKFVWNPTLTAVMMNFIHYLQKRSKKLEVRLHGFSAEDTYFRAWFDQACNLGLISGLVTNSVGAHVTLVSQALEQQHSQQTSMTFKLYVYPVEFGEVDAFRSLADSLRVTTCLKKFELQTLNLEQDQPIAAALAEGIQNNRSIQNMILSAWGSTAIEIFLKTLSVRLNDCALDCLEINRPTFHRSLSRRQSICSSELGNVSKVVISSWHGAITDHFSMDSKLIYLQMSQGNLNNKDMDHWLTQLAVTCPNLATLDVRDNQIESLKFKKYAKSGHKLTSLRELYLDGNPFWDKNSKKDMHSLADGLFCFLNANPRLTSFFHPDHKTPKEKARQQLKHIKLIRTICSLAQGSADYATELPVGAWPLLLEHSNRLLKGSTEHQAGAIFPFLLSASAILGNQSTRSNLLHHQARTQKKRILDRHRVSSCFASSAFAGIKSIRMSFAIKSIRMSHSEIRSKSIATVPDSFVVSKWLAKNCNRTSFVIVEYD
eukprot:scaffold918_cov126-Cylindrotheca_fusiformis.AAC.9